MMICNLRTSNACNHEYSVSLRWELESGNSRLKTRLHKMPQVTNDSELCAELCAVPARCSGQQKRAAGEA